ncbi:MAG: transposase [Planctomycetes bacterium]|nr:transposase [Planctomycetota bacterium]
MTTSSMSISDRWACFRLEVIGGLLASPPVHGELKERLRELSAQHWKHPRSGEPFRVAFSTLERWYYEAVDQSDPIAVLRRKRRKDHGSRRAIGEALAAEAKAQYEAHPSWSLVLHLENLETRIRRQPELGAAPSRATLQRHFRAHGWRRLPAPKSPRSPGALRAERRLAEREVRSFEVEHVGALWHLDFHHASRPVLTKDGWVRPILLGILDDHSRLACHLQWSFCEDTETLVHGLVQAFLKRGLPRAIYSDCGAAMRAEEVRMGLQRLGITLERTLPYSPYQNGKQECFWGSVEGRLLAMVEGVGQPSLRDLNLWTQAWQEKDYHLRLHSETQQTPLERFGAGKSVLRESPSIGELRRAFRRRVTRSQRRSDGTISLEGKRLEIPPRYRSLGKVVLRYASWDLSTVEMIDPETDETLAAIYPVDLARNAEGARAALEERSLTPVPPKADGLAPRMEEILAAYIESGLPPAYIPRAEEER